MAATGVCRPVRHAGMRTFPDGRLPGHADRTSVAGQAVASSTYQQTKWNTFHTTAPSHVETAYSISAEAAQLAEFRQALSVQELSNCIPRVPDLAPVRRTPESHGQRHPRLYERKAKLPSTAADAIQHHAAPQTKTMPDLQSALQALNAGTRHSPAAAINSPAVALNATPAAATPQDHVQPVPLPIEQEMPAAAAPPPAPSTCSTPSTAASSLALELARLQAMSNGMLSSSSSLPPPPSPPGTSASAAPSPANADDPQQLSKLQSAAEQHAAAPQMQSLATPSAVTPMQTEVAQDIQARRVATGFTDERTHTQPSPGTPAEQQTASNHQQVHAVANAALEAQPSSPASIGQHLTQLSRTASSHLNQPQQSWQHQAMNPAGVAHQLANKAVLGGPRKQQLRSVLDPDMFKAAVQQKAVAGTTKQDANSPVLQPLRTRQYQQQIQQADALPAMHNDTDPLFTTVRGSQPGTAEPPAHANNHAIITLQGFLKSIRASAPAKQQQQVLAADSSHLSAEQLDASSSNTPLMSVLKQVQQPGEKHTTSSPLKQMLEQLPGSTAARSDVAMSDAAETKLGNTVQSLEDTAEQHEARKHQVLADGKQQAVQVEEQHAAAVAGGLHEPGAAEQQQQQQQQHQGQVLKQNQQQIVVQPAEDVSSAIGTSNQQRHQAQQQQHKQQHDMPVKEQQQQHKGLSVATVLGQVQELQSQMKHLEELFSRRQHMIQRPGVVDDDAGRRLTKLRQLQELFASLNTDLLHRLQHESERTQFIEQLATQASVTSAATGMSPQVESLADQFQALLQLKHKRKQHRQLAVPLLQHLMVPAAHSSPDSAALFHDCQLWLEELRSLKTERNRLKKWCFKSQGDPHVSDYKRQKIEDRLTKLKQLFGALEAQTMRQYLPSEKNTVDLSIVQQLVSQVSRASSAPPPHVQQVAQQFQALLQHKRQSASSSHLEAHEVQNQLQAVGQQQQQAPSPHLLSFFQQLLPATPPECAESSQASSLVDMLQELQSRHTKPESAPDAQLQANLVQQQPLHNQRRSLVDIMRSLEQAKQQQPQEEQAQQQQPQQQQPQQQAQQQQPQQALQQQRDQPQQQLQHPQQQHVPLAPSAETPMSHLAEPSDTLPDASVGSTTPQLTPQPAVTSSSKGASLDAVGEHKDIPRSSRSPRELKVIMTHPIQDVLAGLQPQQSAPTTRASQPAEPTPSFEGTPVAPSPTGTVGLADFLNDFKRSVPPFELDGKPGQLLSILDKADQSIQTSLLDSESAAALASDKVNISNKGHGVPKLAAQPEPIMQASKASNQQPPQLDVQSRQQQQRQQQQHPQQQQQQQQQQQPHNTPQQHTGQQRMQQFEQPKPAVTKDDMAQQLEDNNLQAVASYQDYEMELLMGRSERASDHASKMLWERLRVVEESEDEGSSSSLEVMDDVRSDHSSRKKNRKQEAKAAAQPAAKVNKKPAVDKKKKASGSSQDVNRWASKLQALQAAQSNKDASTSQNTQLAQQELTSAQQVLSPAAAAAGDDDDSHHHHQAVQPSGPSQPVEVVLPAQCSVRQLAGLLGTNVENLETVLQSLGDNIRSGEDSVSLESAELAALEYGRVVIRSEADAFSSAAAVPRPPVVTVMGHVDHGKTSLLDALRNTAVAASEAGGITQHIGAFEVRLPGSGSRITFLDTPGHAAFGAMRARGAAATDVVVLAVAADDGVEPQTREAIAHARAADCPIVVAITKCDLPGANADKVKHELLAEGIELEEFGGSVQCIETSARTGAGLQDLEEALLLQAEVMELTAPRSCPASAVVVEAQMEKGLGPVATVIVKAGELRVGDPLVVGTEYGKVRILRDSRGRALDVALPGQHALVSGFRGLPAAGDEVTVTISEDRASKIARARLERSEEFRRSQLAKAQYEAAKKHRQRQEQEYKRRQMLKQRIRELKAGNKVRHQTELRDMYAGLAELQEQSGKTTIGSSSAPTGTADVETSAGADQQQAAAAADDAETTSDIMPADVPVVNILIKADVQGSLEAVRDAVLALSGPHAAVKVVYGGVGPVTASDVNLALTTGAKLVAFNLSAPAPEVDGQLKLHRLQLMNHKVIYHLLDEISACLEGAAEPEMIQEVVGTASVVQVFPLLKHSKEAGKVAGCRVLDGSIQRSGTLFRVRRGNDVVFEGRCTSLRRHKLDVDAVGKSNECGIVLNDGTVAELQPGDVIQCIEVRSKRS
eukprot:jgi/Chrzof1/6788/Cz19g09140.t1